MHGLQLAVAAHASLGWRRALRFRLKPIEKLIRECGRRDHLLAAQLALSLVGLYDQKTGRRFQVDASGGSLVVTSVAQARRASICSNWMPTSNGQYKRIG